VVRPAHPWAARGFWHEGPSDADPGFALAALPDGYAYRSGTRHGVGLGVVGRARAVDGALTELAERLRALGAGWIVDDLPPMGAFREGRASVASVQWTTAPAWTDAPRALRIGEAALARDPLSSHGIAAACSEAFLAAAVTSDADVELFALRQAEQRSTHLAALRRTIDNCIFAHEPAWREYADFVTRHAETAAATAPVALRDGRIVQLPAPQ
jgi:hypothetical protein